MSEYSYREGNESDLAAIAELFRRNNYGTHSADWLAVKYFKNPDGAGSVYVAEDSEHNIVATRAHLPRMFTSLKTGSFLTGHSVDLLIDREHRRKGIHTKLKDFVRENRDSRSTVSFPNELARGTSKTTAAETRIFLPFNEWRFPVAIGQLMRGKSYGVIAPLADALSRLYAVLWLGRRPADLQMKPVLRFDRDYEPDPTLIHGIRTADYLNWRFIDNPMRKYSAYEFFENDESTGYCVYALAGASAEVFDLIIYRRWRGCLNLLVDHCRRENISHLSFRSIGFRLGRFGFVKRRPGSYLESTNNPEGDWLITLADSDY